MVLVTGKLYAEMPTTTVASTSTESPHASSSGALDARTRSLISTAQQAWAESPDLSVAHVPRDENNEPAAWSVASSSDKNADRRLELLLVPDIDALQRAKDAAVAGIVVDLDTLCFQPVSELLKAARATGTWAAADAKQTIWLRLPAPRGQGAEVACASAAVFLSAWAEASTPETPSVGFEVPGLRTVEQAARWNQVIDTLERTLGIAHGAVQVTVRLDNRDALRALDEILYPLRNRCNAVRLSMASVLGDLLLDPQEVSGWLPARQDALSLDYPLADAISKHFTVVCHRHGALALSGMLPALPVKDDPEAQEEILQRTAELTQQRLRNGYDGIALAHSGLIAAVEPVIADMMPTANQLERPLDWVIDSDSLKPDSDVEISEAGLRNTVGIAIQGIEAAMQGRGRFALYNYVEDNISTGLCWLMLWHWAHAPEVKLADGPLIDPALLSKIIDEELDIIRLERHDRAVEEDAAEEAASRLLAMLNSEAPPDFPPRPLRPQ